ncbi:hypothetical protein BKA62DRAFT_668646 [Auriculariales sp. MPI-PUGE-AT-0066]|nr:hypothetical protein BKA62DRAFT_668646 [Auriculariales sp. MPI-PUGE-AT-0066]
MAQYLVIREVIPGIRTYSCPFARMGIIPLGGRSTAVQLSDGKSVLVLASTPLTDATRNSVDELGTVKYIIGPDAEHHLYIKEWKTAYPDARVCGVQRTVEMSGVQVDGVWGRDENPLGDDPVVNADFRSEYVPGHTNKEVALLHVPSKTLIQADLLFNLPAYEQYSLGGGKPTGGLMSFVFNPTKMNPHNTTHQSLVMTLAKDKNQVAQSVQVIDSWDFDRIIPCHGDVIETQGKEAWRAAFKQFYDGIAAGKYAKYTPPAAASSAPAVSEPPAATVEVPAPAVPQVAPELAPIPGNLPATL